MENNEFYWDWIKHEDNIFANRANFFMAAEAMLLASLNLMASRHEQLISITLFLMGSFISLIWLWTSAKHVFSTEESIKSILGQTEPRWKIVAEKRRYWGRVHVMMGVVLPLGFLLIWIIFLVLQILILMSHKVFLV